MTDAVRVGWMATEGGLSPLELSCGDGICTAILLRSSIDECIGPHCRKMIPTGTKLSLPDGHAAFVITEPSLATGEEGCVFLANTPGLVDTGYRGEVKLPLCNPLDDGEVRIARGQVAAIVLVLHCPQRSVGESEDYDSIGGAMETRREEKLRFTPLEGCMGIPAYAHSGDNGLDLRVSDDISIAPLGRTRVHFGLSVDVPLGHVALIIPRSGLAAREGLTIAGSPVPVFPGDTTELSCTLLNLDPTETVTLKRGDRAAQLLLVESPSIRLIEVAELDETERGDGGFGSSGVS